ncbi:MAG: DHHA1 domain-containing protein [Candidatus Parvarchaeota archaeon]|nr:DHHA1 domain-containing protein [Candidatus Jingweiarchaeum tengchongense]MCW1298117.1 DHHA1 domain-containing protein [Candidatus Jingweiarchaeum tengchongense]MCW1305131.1 DHHA1 domain-containing protein [Candidatus Jingweiarchaeum tengchongense]MCW1305538.1 DHHA1 domain-containing protein [Candidatus Jingweiarchaeum tengchongense]
MIKREKLEKSRIVIIHHNDADGICSSALFISLLKKFGNFPVSIFSPKYIEVDTEVMQQLKNEDYDLIVFLDLPNSELNKFERDYLVIDHHPPKTEHKQMIFDENHCSSYLTFKFCSTYLNFSKYAWIACVGCLADKDLNGFEELKEIAIQRNKELTEEVLNTMVHFISSARILAEEGVRYALNSLLEAAESGLPTTILGSTPNSEKLVELKRKSIIERNYWLSKLSEIAIEHDKFTFVRIRSNLPIQSYLAGTLANLNQDKICIVINEEPTKDYAMVEGRTRIDNFDLGKIFREVCKELNSSGGGHKKAAGAKILKSEVENFIKKVIECDSQ